MTGKKINIVIKKYSLTKDKNGQLWKNFNKTVNIPNMKKNNKIEYVSGTGIKNYIFNDPLLDYLKLKKTKHQKNNSSRQLITDSSNMLFGYGNTFEDKIFDHLATKFPGQTTRILDKNIMPSEDMMGDTYEQMCKGVPIILQAVLYNNTNMTFGVADIIVRSDFINKLFNYDIINKKESQINALNITKPKGKKYHYVVIDIKWSKIMYCVDGETIRNNNRIKSYKAQLAIYTAALGQLQGYTPDKAYIWAKTTGHTENNIIHTSDDIFDNIGVVDFLGFDNKYIDMTYDAITWIQNVRNNWKKWTITPPSIPELYPNMKNHYDGYFHEEKSKLADELGELTSVWMIGYKNRKIAHDKKIYSWRDKRCISKNIGINGKKVAPMLDKILKINRGRVKMSPRKVTNNIGDWKTKHGLEFYVDFETMNSTLYKNEIDIHKPKTNNIICFMIGVGYMNKSGIWKYKSFYMSEINEQNELKLINDFVKFINKKIMDNDTYAKFIHWGSAEVSILNQLNRKYNYMWTEFISSIKYTDLLTVFKLEPIVIKGALNFGLKDISKAMHSHKMITTTWPQTHIESGEDAMMSAIRYYQNDYKDENELQRLINYNEIDCKVLSEILCYLRKYKK